MFHSELVTMGLSCLVFELRSTDDGPRSAIIACMAFGGQQ